MDDLGTPASARGPQPHRTIDRVTQILEEVIYRPGMTFTELTSALDAPKSSVHGFIQGLLSSGWLYEADRRFYLGPAVYSLTLATGSLRFGLVRHEDMIALREATGLGVLLGVRVGDHLIYVATEEGPEPLPGFDARANIRRTLLSDAGGWAILATLSDAERHRYLQAHGEAQPERRAAFQDALAQLQDRGAVAVLHPNQGYGEVAAGFADARGDAIASVALVGAVSEIEGRTEELTSLLRAHVDGWQERAAGAAVGSSRTYQRPVY